MAADSCPPSERSRYFYYLYSTFLVCELFAPALAGATLRHSVLIPFAIGLCALLACYPILAIMPETHQPPRETLRRDTSELVGLVDAIEAEALLPPRRHGSISEPGASVTVVSVLRQRNLPLALVVLGVGALRQATVSVLLQYAAARFQWPIAQTAVLISAIAAMNIVLFLLVLPQCIVFMTARWRISSQVIDYNIVSVSLCILAIGSLLMGLAPSAHALIPGKLALHDYLPHGWC